MAGKIFFCFITAFALIQPFNTLPAAENKQDVIYRNSKGEYYTSDGVILSDQYPVYWRHKNANEPKNEHVVIVEPTITYTRQAEYTSTQAAPSTTFRASQNERESNFKPYDGSSGRTESSAVAYYPYYVRSSSSDRNDMEERRRYEERRRIEDSKRVVIDASDPGYQRFVPRDRDGSGQGQTWYYYSDSPSSSSAAPPSKPTTQSKSSVVFYYSNGTAIRTDHEDGKQVMYIHPNKYEIQVTEIKTTTTPRPETTTIDCPPFQPCNTVVYQQTTQCCKCYLVPNRCCPCTYPSNNRNKK